MPRIKIKDLPKDTKISKEAMKKISGGLDLTDISQMSLFDLQPAMQSQSQYTQILSNVMKSIRDSQSSIIKNIR